MSRAADSTTAPPAQFAASASTEPPAASPPCFSSSVVAWIVWKRLPGSGSSTGKGTIQSETRFPGAPSSSAVRMPRDYRAQRLARNVFAIRAQGFPDGAAHHREHDVVHRAAEAARDGLHRPEVELAPRDVAVRADRAVEGHGRGKGEPGAEQAPKAARGGADPRDARPRVGHGAAEPAPEIHRGARAPRDLVAQEVARRGRRTRFPDARGGVGGRRLNVEQRSQHADAGDAVDDAMVNLRHQCEAAAREPLDHPGFPERSPPVERPLEDLGATLGELLGGSRMW